MKTSNSAASQDPTFEKQGPMSVFLINETDAGGTSPFPLNLENPPSPNEFLGLPIESHLVSLTYDPKAPPWNQGTDWFVIPGRGLPPATFPVIYSSGRASSVGCAEVLRLKDRGPNKVAAGGKYVFDLPFKAGYNKLSIYFIMSGVGGGSTILPGFGLYNLSSKKNAWTYITAPPPFNGVWSLQVRGDSFVNTYTLRVEYVRYSGLGSFGKRSRLVYSVFGRGNVLQPWRIPGAGEAPDFGEERMEDGQVPAMIEIVGPGRR